EDWAKKIDDIDVSFFFDYTIGGLIDMIDEKPVYPKGTLVHHDGLTYMADKRSDGIFLLRPVSVDGYTANRFQRLENRYFQDGILPQYYEEGIPVVYAEKAYSCVSCDPSLYKRVPVLQTAKKQGNGVSFEAPADWAVLFEEQKPDDLV